MIDTRDLGHSRIQVSGQVNNQLYSEQHIDRDEQWNLSVPPTCDRHPSTMYT